MSSNVLELQAEAMDAEANLGSLLRKSLAAGKATGGVRQPPDAASIENWPSRSLIAGIAPGDHSSRSPSQLHILDMCIERGPYRR